MLADTFTETAMTDGDVALHGSLLGTVLAGRSADLAILQCSRLYYRSGEHPDLAAEDRYALRRRHSGVVDLLPVGEWEPKGGE